MQKRILTSLLLASAFSTNVYALGLGDIEVYSALNQPLDAEIEITSAKPGETDSLIVQLATEQAFLKAGVERPYLLSKIKFAPAIKADGTPIIKVTSKNAVREPFLNFLVDVEWPRGRLVREYTILLDPPSFATRQPVTTAAPVTAAPAPEASAGLAPIQREEEVVEEVAAEETFAEAVAADAEVAEAEVGVAAVAVEEEVAEAEMVVEEDVATLEEEVAAEGEVDQAALAAEALAYDEPVEDVAMEEEAPTDSPFSDLLSDLDGEATSEFSEDAFAPTAEPEVAAAPLAAEDLPLDGELPDISLTLDETLPYNAESILAADNDYVDPEIEALLRADPVPMYREPEPEPEPIIVEAEPEPEGYLVEKGDIMLRIAEQYRPGDVDINQAMLAIMRYNPEAFIDNNVNLVREGYVLRIPDREAMLSLTSGAALAQVQEQNALWREYKAQLAGAQSELEAEEVAEVEPAVEEAVEADAAAPRLSLVAPGRDEEAAEFAAGEQEGSGEIRRIERNLALAVEKLEATKLEREEIQSRIAELQDIVTKSEGIINLKNEQLAQIQSSAEQAAEAAAQAEGEAATEEEAAFAAADGALDDVLGVEEGEEESAAVAVVEAEGEEVAAAEATTEVEEAAAPAAVAEPAQAARPSGLGGIIYDLLPPGMRPGMQSLLDGPLVWLIVALPVIILLAVLFVLRGRNKEEPALVAEPAMDETAAANAELEAAGVPKAAIAAPSLLDKIKGIFSKKAREPKIVFEEEPESTSEAVSLTEEPALDETVAATVAMDSAGDMEATMVASAEDLAGGEVAETVVSAEPAAAVVEEDSDDIQDDTTAEADVYIAYGLFDQAIDLLQQAIGDNPDTAAYRGKLLETYFNAGKKDEFVNAAQALKEQLAGSSSRVWDKAVVMGKEIAPDNALFSGAEVSSDLKASDFAAEKPEAADFELDTGGEEAGTDFDLGSDELDLSASDLSESEEVELGDSGSEDEFSLDDVASELGSAEAEEAPVAEEEGELEFDVSDFIDETEEEEAPAEEEELEFDIDAMTDEVAGEEEISMDLGEVEEAPVEEAAADDLEFDLGEVDLGEASEEAPAADIDLGLEEEASEADMDLGLAEESVDFGADLDLGTEEAEPAAEAAADDLGFDLDSLGEEEIAAPAEEEGDLEFDLGDLDLGSEEPAADLTQGLDSDLLADDAESTQMIDEDSLETMIDDMDSSDSDFGLGEDLPDNLDEVGTKLDLAKAYIDMGDAEGAKSSLEEVLQEGNEQQKSEAQELLAQI